MSEIDTVGFVRMQTQSRIAANQWRQWCSLCNLEPGEAVEVWDEVGYPVMITTRSAPPISFVLQMRSERRDVDILDFKDEIAKVLVFSTFMDVLQDERLSEGKGRGAVFRFYRARVAEGSAEHYDPLCMRDFGLDLCKILLIAKVLNQPNIVLSQVINIVLKKQASMEQLIKLGIKCLDEQPYAAKVREALEADDHWDEQEEREEVSENKEEADEGDERREEEDEEVETAEEEEEDIGHGEEIEEEEFEEGEEIDDDEEERPRNSVEKFRAALAALYRTEARGSSADAKKAEHLLRTRLEAIGIFDPLRAIIPNIEEAEAIVERQQTVQNRSQRNLGGGGAKGSRGGKGLATLKRDPFASSSSSSPTGGSAIGGQTPSGARVGRHQQVQRQWRRAKSLR